ncbi:MAG: WYL domain-containing protein [Chryseobacterium sp.]|nr:MAG: WYL domain-containing protein [Chryseobacterium sp.]
MYQDNKLTEIVIQVDLYAARHLGEQKYYHGYTEEKEIVNGIEMIFLTSSLEGFARWYLMFADYARIISPQHLKDRVHSIIQKISL